MGRTAKSALSRSVDEIEEDALAVQYNPRTLWFRYHPNVQSVRSTSLLEGCAEATVS